jgi:hypothetical protein
MFNDSSTSSSIDSYYMSPDPQSRCYSDVYVRHADGSETQIGDDVAIAYARLPDQQVTYGFWECPELDLDTGDGIKIVAYVTVGDTTTSATFLTSQLKAVKLNSTCWRFTRCVHLDFGGCSPETWWERLYLFFGGTCTQVRSISLSPKLINFQPADASEYPGYMPTGSEPYSDSRGFGWR